MSKRISYIFGWALIIAINFYFIYNFTFRHFTSESNNDPFVSLLRIHIVFGMIALLIGPFQFFPSIRKKHVYFHRLTGRIYLMSILISGIIATFLTIFDVLMVQHRVVFGTGVLGFALSWFITSGMAFWAVKNRNFVQHREWMVKSYVVTCGFSTYRIFAVTLNDYFQLDYDTVMSGIMAWACWSVPLLITEAIIQAKKIKRAHVAAKAAR